MSLPWIFKRNLSKFSSSLVQRAQSRCPSYQRHLSSTRELIRERLAAQLDSVAENRYPNDLGILPGTYFMPLNNNTLSTLKDKPFALLTSKWRHLKSRITGYPQVLMYKFGYGVRPYPKISRRHAKATAIALHQRLFTAYAAGDVQTIKVLCGEGLYMRLKSLINTRPKNLYTDWKLHRYIGFQGIVSHRAIALPLKNSAIRQLVIKIRSVQSLSYTRREKTGVEHLAGSHQPQHMTEYMVLQRRIYKGKEGPWKIWGTEEAISDSQNLTIDGGS